MEVLSGLQLGSRRSQLGDIRVKILLAAMPDTVSALDAVVKVPNLGLCSLAAAVPADHEVRIVDLAFRGRKIDRYLTSILDDFQPDLVGLSAMSFQFASACHVAQLVREKRPEAALVLGGYHASLQAEEIGHGPFAPLFDFLVRGEGEATLAELVRRYESPFKRFDGIPGLSYWNEGRFVHGASAPLLDLASLLLPRRDVRLIQGARFLGLKLDCAETSRGCGAACKFCSITRVYGRAIRYFPLDRVIEDLRSLKASGTQGVFFVDDNITLNTRRLAQLCDLIVRDGLQSMFYVMQASVTGIASDPNLAPLLRAAGFRWVFLGIENGSDDNLKGLGKAGSADAAARAVRLLRDQGIGVFGGFIVGLPGDGRAEIRDVFRFALDLGVDHAIVQSLTPYPGTETRRELLEAGLVENADDFSRYNGFIANARTRHLSAREVSRAVGSAGLRLYFRPRYMLHSRLWRESPALVPPLLVNNFRYLAEARRNEIFRSRHSWT